jgi:medium-chain acyl-[acyl-carrier-protein] hydrolase
MEDLAFDCRGTAGTASPAWNRQPEPLDHDAWLLRSRAHPRPSLRLYCFGYACGGASAFETWSARLDPRIEVCRLQLPGRETRRTEPPLVRLDLVYRLFDEIARRGDAIPFAFFGYCMGGRIAIAVARHLRRKQLALPSAMFVAAAREPAQIRHTDIPKYELSDDDMLRYAAKFCDIPAHVLNDPHRLRRLLMLMRADIELSDTIEFAREAPFAFPLTVFGGREDGAVRAEHLLPWKDHSTGPFTLLLLDGPHMFIDTQCDPILAQVRAQLAPLLEAV